MGRVDLLVDANPSQSELFSGLDPAQVNTGGVQAPHWQPPLQICVPPSSHACVALGVRDPFATASAPIR